MATEPCEVLERKDECPDPIKETPTQKEEIQKQLKEESKEDAKLPPSKEEVISTPNGIEKGDTDKLHVVDKDLDEFVDSMAEAAPAEVPEKPLEVEKPLLPEKAPAKLPRAEQVAEKVLRAEKVTERPLPRAEKLPAAEKAPEPKVARVEKVPRAEKTGRAEKTTEKTRPAAPAAPKTVPVKRRTEARGAGPAKDTLPWEGLTLNKCLLVASFVALLSVSCQVVQDIIDYGENVLMAELSAWTLQDGGSQEGSVGELDERWFYERWFDWSDADEPPEIEEEEELIEIEEEEEEEPAEEEEETEPIEEEEEEEELKEEEEELEEEPATKVGPKKSREKVSRREKAPKDKRAKGHKAPEDEDEEEEEEEEDEEEEKHPPRRRPRRERKGKEERQRREESKSRPSKEAKRQRRPKEEPESEKGHPKLERDSKPHEHKDRKPWQAERPFFSPHKSGKHRVQEGKKRD